LDAEEGGEEGDDEEERVEFGPGEGWAILFRLNPVGRRGVRAVKVEMSVLDCVRRWLSSRTEVTGRPDRSGPPASGRFLSGDNKLFHVLSPSTSTSTLSSTFIPLISDKADVNPEADIDASSKGGKKTCSILAPCPVGAASISISFRRRSLMGDLFDPPCL
jgi:hypothetical protein